MRRQLSLGAAAVTATVLVAFVVPLAFAVQALAAAQPMNAAEQLARSLATVVALTEDHAAIEASLIAAQAGSETTLSVLLADGTTIGQPVSRDAAVRSALRGASFAAPAENGRAVFVATRGAGGQTAVVRAHVADEVLRAGVTESWLLLAALALVLLVVAVAAADWLARSVVNPVGSVAATARQLAGGDLAARAAPGGPPEIVDVAEALNLLAARIRDLLAAEREMVADLSHRLRTPMTALRVNAAALRDPAERRRLLADVDAVEATVTGLIRQARQPRDETQTVDLVEVTRERAEYWGALADEQGRAWTLELPEGAVPVAVSAADAAVLVDVLLDNVFTHTDEPAGYAVRCSATGLVVEDEGPGLTDETVRQRGRSGAGSTGLGLDIVRQIAARAGGEVHLGRGAAGGARVEVRLPAQSPVG